MRLERAPLPPPDARAPTAVPANPVAPPPPGIRVRNLVKRFRSRATTTTVLDGVSLDVAAGERMVLLGPSGCGKTTLLRCIAGLEVPDEGEIEIDGRVVFSSARRQLLPPEQRGISMVFQSYALWPHMTVARNVAYPLRHRPNTATDAPDSAAAVESALKLVGCAGLGGRYPSQLSGGQQQRVSLARAIVGSRGIILFDEPLSNVDAKVREQLRVDLVLTQKALGFACLYVTHDQTEAAAIADRMVVMQAGSIAQIGTPQDVFGAPASASVASFIGASNRVFGVVAGIDPAGTVQVATAMGQVPATPRAQLEPGQPVNLLFRPEHVRISRTPDEATGAWPALTASVLFLGGQYEHVLLAGTHQIVARGAEPLLTDGDKAWLSVPPQHLGAYPDPAPPRQNGP